MDPEKEPAASPEPSFRDGLDKLDQMGLLRTRVTVTGRRPGYLRVGDQEYIDFSSNDYLGLACDPHVTDAIARELSTAGWGAGASPLVTGFHDWHEKLESTFATFLGTEAALLFESGFAANTGVIPALVGPGDVVFCDKRNHASLVDGCKLSRAKLQVYRTHSLDHLESRLARCAGRSLIVTDSVFSMDGDVAPLGDLCGLAERYNARLFVDEAHALGVLGPEGRGLCAELGVEHRIALRMVTLGKALGGIGAIVACDTTTRDWLVNRARPYIYSTALPPVASVAALAALELARSQPQRRERVMQLANQLASGAVKRGYDTLGSVTPIVPIVTGTPDRALALAQRLRDHGFWVTAIRPPTVQSGFSRIRVSLSAAHQKLHIEQFLQVLGNHT